MAVRQMLVAGRYRLLEPVGAGGMGRVWLAHDEMLHRDIAIKEIVPPDWMSGAEQDRLRERTLREARSAARLSHPHVVRVYDVVHADGLSWIVMEYIPSRSLHQVLHQEGPYDPAGAARIGLAVLDALDAAHQAGVLHRDVKPHNVLIGTDGRVVLTDFGLATFVDDGTVTTPGLIVGSPQYVSPERARDGASTVESDLWSFGATLYAAVEGHSPYARETAMATLAALATEPPDPPVRAGPLAPILAGLLRYEPADRLTAAEVESRLLGIVAADHRDGPLVPGRRGPRRARAEEPGKAGDEPSGEIWFVAASSPEDDPLSVGDWHSQDSGLVVPAPRPEPPAEKWHDIPETGNDPFLTGVITRYGSPLPALEPVRTPAVTEQPAATEQPAVTEQPAATERPGDQRLLPVIVAPPAAPIPERPARPPRATLMIAGVLILLLTTGLLAGLLTRDADAPDTVVLPPANTVLPSPADTVLPSAASPAGTVLPSPESSAGGQAEPQPITKEPVASRKPTPRPGGFSPIACDASPPTGLPATPQKGAARGVNGWTLQAGWSYFTDGSGFHLAVPDGWTYQRIGTLYCFRDPGSTRSMSLDTGRDPAASPVKACRAEDRRLRREGRIPGYASIGVAAVPLLHRAADWDVRYRDGGTLRRASTRWLTIGDDAYAIGWATPDTDWAGHVDELRMVRTTFYTDHPPDPADAARRS
ncbi:protein kinase [Actinoplanes sp. NPDC023936]|uniref:serine/threonine-protein kinase n=1 Tax=Actinoplanes sp. NPDC023936 TaxID=3154910 RepID=UPI0033EAA2D5